MEVSGYNCYMKMHVVEQQKYTKCFLSRYLMF